MMLVIHFFLRYVLIDGYRYTQPLVAGVRGQWAQPPSQVFSSGYCGVDTLFPPTKFYQDMKSICNKYINL